MLSDTRRQKSNRKKREDFNLQVVKGGRKLREAQQFFLKQETMKPYDNKV